MEQTYTELPESVAGYHFDDQALLQRALTHRSYLNEHPGQVLEDNERLEFLGDAVLSIVTALYLYNRFPEYREGELTRLRAALVRRETLAQFARQMHIDQHLLLGRGEEESGGRRRPAILCDAFEAVVGAVYLDGGLDAASSFIEPLIQKALPGILARHLSKDPRSELQELSQARFQITPRYRTVGEYGPDHAKEFIVETYIGDLRFGRGSGPTKQAAAKMAAIDAIERLGEAQSLAEAVPLAELDTDQDYEEDNDID